MIVELEAPFRVSMGFSVVFVGRCLILNYSGLDFLWDLVSSFLKVI
jgi:hypothetical protein